jgi:Ca2+-transporting ATPase
VIKKYFICKYEMANNALRVIAFAYKKLSALPDNLLMAELEKNLVFVGLEGMIDPPRPEAIESIKSCYQAGITLS